MRRATAAARRRAPWRANPQVALACIRFAEWDCPTQPPTSAGIAPALKRKGQAPIRAQLLAAKRFSLGRFIVTAAKHPVSSANAENRKLVAIPVVGSLEAMAQRGEVEVASYLHAARARAPHSTSVLRRTSPFTTLSANAIRAVRSPRARSRPSGSTPVTCQAPSGSPKSLVA